MNDQRQPHTKKPYHPPTKQLNIKSLKSGQVHKHKRGDERGTALERSASQQRWGA